MSAVMDRFLKYVVIDTTSNPSSETFPSVPETELPFADMLAEELRQIGVSDVSRDEYGYVFGTIPSTIENYDGPVIGFLAHMDTSFDAPGKDVRPRIIENYDGGDIELGNGLILRPDDFESLKKNIGRKLIVTDGSTLLGGDDKAGVAEIMTAAEYLLEHPEIPHGPIKVGFTPDEEIGRGVDYFDVKRFGADYAYTMDGGELGELEYETFNAAAGIVEIFGTSIHPGAAKGKMVSAVQLGIEFQGMLPVFERPEHTEGREGFTHLHGFTGTADRARLDYIIRDHDRAKFEKKKAFLQEVGRFLNTKYGEGTVKVTVEDSYYNMGEVISQYPFLLDYARDVYKDLGIEAITVPVRGGTDGSRLSFMGLPCPNLGTGDYNCHGRYEYVCVDKMEMAVKVIVGLCERFAR
ncbi:MAG: peptidase T [Firmicutes bacterium]|nr:peptidase T [Bacillota bacterium]